MMLQDDLFVEAETVVRLNVANSLNGWAFVARALSKPQPVHLQRVVVLYESACSHFTVAFYWGDVLIATLKSMEQAVGYSYPTTQLFARRMSEDQSGDVVATFVVSADLDVDNRFLVEC
jgi:hypothetical protein